MFRKAAAALVLGLGLMPVAAPPAHATRDTESLHFVALPYRAQEWSYLDVASGAFPEFPAPSAANGAFIQGQAGFGTVGHGCKFNNGYRVQSNWTRGTDLLLTHYVALAGLAPSKGENESVRIIGTLTGGSADIYYNGDLIKHVDSTSNCARSNINVITDVSHYKDEDGETLNNGVLSVRAAGNGQPVTFADFRSLTTCPVRL